VRSRVTPTHVCAGRVENSSLAKNGAHGNTIKYAHQRNSHQEQRYCSWHLCVNDTRSNHHTLPLHEGIGVVNVCVYACVCVCMCACTSVRACVRHMCVLVCTVSTAALIVRPVAQPTKGNSICHIRGRLVQLID
jgi:hypothetical protein